MSYIEKNTLFCYALDSLFDLHVINYLRASRKIIMLLNVNPLETCAFEELGSEFINFASNCVINTLRLIVYLTGLSI